MSRPRRPGALAPGVDDHTEGRRPRGQQQIGGAQRPRGEEQRREALRRRVETLHGHGADEEQRAAHVIA